MRKLRTTLHYSLGLIWLFQALIPRSDLHQLVHWPDLLAHYEAHQHQPSTHFADFWDFLAAHYLDGDGQPHPEHESLPLHHSHSPTYCLPLPLWQPLTVQAESPTVFISRPGPQAAVGYPHTDPRPPQRA